MEVRTRWEWIDAADVAKVIRKDLKKRWPGTRFSVRTDKYAGGASIRVVWTDGPSYKEVDAVTRRYAGKGFDGMIDMEYGMRHWRLPDGSIVFAGTSGTVSSRGVYEEIVEKIRQRAREVIEEKHGNLSSAVVHTLAANATVDETTFGRLLLPGNYSKPTRHPRMSTVTTLALALEVPVNWLAHGVGSKQIDAWPTLVRMEAEDPEPFGSARDELMAAIGAMTQLPLHVQRRAFRAAVGGAIEAISAQDAPVPVRAYRALVRLDDLHRMPEPERGDARA